MKKTFLFIFYCMAYFALDCHAQQPPQENIELLFNFKSIIDPNQYELGLNLVEIQIVNTGRQSFQTSPLFWEIYDEEQLHWHRFWASNTQQTDLIFGPYGMQTLSAHLNLAAININWYKNHTTQSQGNFMLRAGVYCCENSQTYYTEALRIKVFPLNAIDKAAWALLQRSGFTSQQQFHPDNLSKINIKPAIVDSLVHSHPKSTFTTLACLAQVHYYMKQPDSKERALASLVRPLMSRFTYIRYLSEELAKLCL